MASLNPPQNHLTETQILQKVFVTPFSWNTPQSPRLWILPYCNKSITLILFDYKCIPGGLLLQGINNMNWYNYFENCLAISTKAENMHAQWPQNFSPRYKPSRNKSLYVSNKIHKNIYSGTIHNREVTRKKTPKSINTRINKLWYIVTLELYTQ